MMFNLIHQMANLVFWCHSDRLDLRLRTLKLNNIISVVLISYALVIFYLEMYYFSYKLVRSRLWHYFRRYTTVTQCSNFNALCRLANFIQWARNSVKKVFPSVFSKIYCPSNGDSFTSYDDSDANETYLPNKDVE